MADNETPLQAETETETEPTPQEILLAAVKTRLSIADEYHDDVLNALIEDTAAYMQSAGVLPAVIDSDKAVGCIARGVADQWNMGAADGKFSDIFRERVIQLTMETTE